MKFKFLDFRYIHSGTIVTRSEHWNKERCVKKNARKQLGIITDHQFYTEHGRIITYPVIHWEGAVHSSATHPANATPYRKHHALEYIEVEIDGDEISRHFTQPVTVV